MSAADGCSGASSSVATILNVPFGSGATTTSPAGREIQLHLVATVRPVHPDVRQHERLFIRTARELRADGRADDAVHAVRADGKAGDDHPLASLRVTHRLDAGGTLRQPRRGHAPVDPAAERRQAVRQDPFRRILRKHEQVRVLRWQSIEWDLQQPAISVADRECGQLQPLGSQPWRYAELVEHVERMRVNYRRSRRVLARGELVDQHVFDARLLQANRERQPGWAGADDEDVRG